MTATPKKKSSNPKIHKPMRKPTIVQASISDTINILGHDVDGYQTIRNAVEFTSSPGSTTIDKKGKVLINHAPYVSACDPNIHIPGLHVLEIYKIYPCFDSSDFINEDRYFRNFFFSGEPFTREQIIRIACMKRVGNLEFITDEMPEWALPSAYYVGEGDTIIYAF